MKKFTPIYEDKQGNRFVLAYQSHVHPTKQESWETGWGHSLINGVLGGYKFSGDVLEFEMTEYGQGHFPHVAAKMGRYNVMLIGGPLFEEAKNAQ